MAWGRERSRSRERSKVRSKSKSRSRSRARARVQRGYGCKAFLRRSLLLRALTYVAKKLLRSANRALAGRELGQGQPSELARSEPGSPTRLRALPAPGGLPAPSLEGGKGVRALSFWGRGKRVRKQSHRLRRYATQPPPFLEGRQRSREQSLRLVLRRATGGKEKSEPFGSLFKINPWCRASGTGDEPA